MRARPRELQFVALDPVKQKPIRFDMQVAKSLPVTLQRMIPIAGGDRLRLDQQQQDRLQFLHILAAFLGSLHVPLEPT